MRLNRRSRRSPLVRRAILEVDRLESRELLSTAAGGRFTVAPLFRVNRPAGVLRPSGSASPPVGAFTPAQVQAAYGFDKISFGGVKGDGAGQTIAIVNAYHSPNIQADLDTFSTQFGLPLTTITKVDQAGGTNYPAVDTSGGWTTETALDVQWAHAIAPAANILLVEANSAFDSDLLTAVDYASAHASVVSMSWGGGEFAGETSASYENHFKHSGVVFVAASGDNGAPVSWPSSAPNVLSVGGTALTVNASTNAWASETGWSGSGGGPSAYEAQPAYQKGVVTQTTTRRANPDVAYNASPSTGFAVYDSTAGGWLQVGGTSAGAPQWAALVAIADQGRTLARLPAINSGNPQEVFTILYKGAGSGRFHDITTGASTGTPSFKAGPGYDYVTGIGTPLADLVVPALVGFAPLPVESGRLVVSAPTTSVAGGSFKVTVTAQGAGGATDTGYTGTVRFTSTDPQARLPIDTTFTAADRGVRSFTVSFAKAANQALTVTDISNSAVVGTSTIAVSPAAASQFVLSGLPSTTTVGAGVSVTVTAKDPYGNLATNYAGTVRFTSTDPQATLPSDSTINLGVGTFPVRFGTAGIQSVTIADASEGPSATSSGVAVAPAVPLNLTAVAASSTQITLNWASAAGATSYLIERAKPGGTTWTALGATDGGTTTYRDTGLTAGTSYVYRVRAVGGGRASDPSNTASATTPGGVVATGTSLWDDAFTPRIDAYGRGSYELGVRFRSDTAGNVTGVRFYKQTWMGGVTHSGSLWAADGTLLASAKFINEKASGWVQVSFANPVAIAANTSYVVSFSTGGGYFGISTTGFLGAGRDNGPLHALPDGVAGSNGVFSSGTGRFPSSGAGGWNFWADVVFVSSTSPGGGGPIKSSALVSAPVAVPSAVVIGKGSGNLGGAPATRTTPAPKPAPTIPMSWIARRSVADPSKSSLPRVSWAGSRN